MAGLGPVAWPPTPIRTERLVLRAPEPGDRAAVIELNASPEVCAYIGGPQPHEELERAIPEVPTQRPGGFVVNLDEAAIGIASLERRNAEYEIRQAVRGDSYSVSLWSRTTAKAGEHTTSRLPTRCSGVDPRTPTEQQPGESAG